jgi:2-keto-4-pentenoate hydratase
MTEPWEDPRVQEGLARQAEDLDRRVRGGASHIGWKVGFGAPASLELMQITAPLMGFLTRSAVLESGASVEVSGWTRGVVEFELAVYLGEDLDGETTPDRARAAVAAVGPSIELADIDLAVGPEHVADIVAGNIFHAGVVFGERDPTRAGLDIDGLEARILIDGVERHRTTDLQAITGPYPKIVATVANTLASIGKTLRAGDVIITGSVTPPISVGEGSDFTFHLEPFAPISVEIS